MKIMRLPQWWDFGYIAQNLVEINIEVKSKGKENAVRRLLIIFLILN